MRITEIIENTGWYLYHGTSRNNLPKISREGLRPMLGNNFPDDEPYPEPRLYAANNSKQAIRDYADAIFQDDGVVLRFPFRGAKWINDGFGEYWTTSVIPPSRIEIRLTDERWHPLEPTLRSEPGG